MSCALAHCHIIHNACYTLPTHYTSTLTRHTEPHYVLYNTYMAGRLMRTTTGSTTSTTSKPRTTRKTRATRTTIATSTPNT